MLEIAVGISNAGYQGVVIHNGPLASGEHFFGINFREDTPEGKIFSKIRSDYERGLAIPSSRGALKKIRGAYEQKAAL